MSEPSLLEKLSQGYKQTTKQKLDVPEIELPLFTKPFNLVDSASIASIAREVDPTQQALRMAKLIVSKVITEDGEKAFWKGTLDKSANLMATSVDPVLITKLYQELQQHGLPEDKISELEGKPEDTEDSPSSSISSQTAEA